MMPASSACVPRRSSNRPEVDGTHGTAAARAPAPAGQRIEAIGFTLLALALITLSDVAAKIALETHGVGEVMFARGLLGSLMLGTLMVARLGVSVLLPRRRGFVLARSTLHCFGSVCWYVAFATLPLADVYAMGYATPLVVSLLAIPLLGERVGWQLWASLLVGFAGVLVMVQPGGAFWQPAALVLVGGVVLVALARVMARKLVAFERVDTIVFWLLLMHMPLGLAGIALNGAVAPTLASAVALLAMAGLNLSGHLLMTRAYLMSPISALAPYEYSTFLWALGFGIFVFGEIPGVSTLLGCAIIISAGLYDLRRVRMERIASVRA